MTKTASNPRAASFRSTIIRFIKERQEEKLKGTAQDSTLAAKYEYGAWLADAARRVSQLQVVTHILKATHSNAQGSSLYANPTDLPHRDDIGTHSLGKAFTDDVVGNAAALDVYKFLKLEVENRRLLDWFLQDDADLLDALHEDAETARAWASAFKGLLRLPAVLQSHEKAKQVYWCHSGKAADDTGFHLLEPLFPSTLLQTIHAEINDARFGEENRAAHHAKREQQAHGGVYREYRHLAVRQLGGTKPHNVSQLNSERGGVNYLLASLPPQWNQGHFKSLLGSESVFPRFERHEGVRPLLNALLALLKKNPDPTKETRLERELIEQALGRCLASFGAEMRRRHSPGWTRDAQCQLPEEEKLWLDPERANSCRAEDKDFSHDFTWADWPDKVATNFADWVNDKLRKAGLPMGSVEQKHWIKQALIEVDWPATMRRHPLLSQETKENSHE